MIFNASTVEAVYPMTSGRYTMPAEVLRAIEKHLPGLDTDGTIDSGGPIVNEHYLITVRVECRPK